VTASLAMDPAFLELAIPSADCDLKGSTGVVGQTTKHALRTAQEFHAGEFACPDLLGNQTDGLHRAARKKRSLIRGYSDHPDAALNSV